MKNKLALLVFLFWGFGSEMAYAARYVDNHDGTVTDTRTKLMWQQAGSEQGMTWHNALFYCESSTTGGYGDWRAPRVDELRTLVDYTRHDPAIDPVFQSGPWDHWSGSTCTPFTDCAWLVGFNYGYVLRYLKRNTTSVQCVRGGPYWSFDPSHYLQAQTEHTVKDTFRGYVWQKSDDGQRRNWAAAKTYCDNLDLDGYTNWRLPAIDELQTIIDNTAWNPSLSTEILNGRSRYYWSSSTFAVEPTHAWCVGFKSGSTDYHRKDYRHYTRCVRAGFVTLTLSKAGTGGGKITSFPARIACGSDCTGKFRNGSTVTLVPKAYSGSVFEGWSVGGCYKFGTEACTLTVVKDIAVIAKFGKVSLNNLGDDNETMIDNEE